MVEASVAAGICRTAAGHGVIRVRNSASSPRSSRVDEKSGEGRERRVANDPGGTGRALARARAERRGGVEQALHHHHQGTHDQAHRAIDAGAQQSYRMQHPERSFGLGPGGELIAKLFGPHRQRLPHHQVHGDDYQEQCEQAEHHLGVAPAVGGLHQEAAQARQAVSRGSGGDDFAGDEEVPSRDPRQDRVVHQFGHACRER